MRILIQTLFFSSLLGFSGLLYSEEVKVAVAANFTAPMEQIAAAFEQETGHKAVLAFGATGALYAQISHGAPFAVLLSADDKTTRRLANEGKALADSEFTYAIGKLVLWSPDPDLIDNEGKVLGSGQFKHVAIANPDTAPYGQAAVEFLKEAGLYESIKPKLVTGDNISQAFQFVRTGNADIGFVALSQVFNNGRIVQGSAWTVPGDRYAPIRQNAILLNGGTSNAAAKAILQFLQSDKAKALIKSFGYAL